jgi:hypothetical protein
VGESFFERDVPFKEVQRKRNLISLSALSILIKKRRKKSSIARAPFPPNAICYDDVNAGATTTTTTTNGTASELIN